MDLRFKQHFVSRFHINRNKVTGCLIFVLLNIEHYLVLQKVILLHFSYRFPPFPPVRIIVEIYV